MVVARLQRVEFDAANIWYADISYHSLGGLQLEQKTKQHVVNMWNVWNIRYNEHSLGHLLGHVLAAVV